MIYHIYRSPAFSDVRSRELLASIQKTVSSKIIALQTEWQFYVESSRPLQTDEYEKLEWLLRETYEPDNFGTQSASTPNNYLEVGPRLAIVSPYSTNAVSICRACGLESITRIERSCRYIFTTSDGRTISAELTKQVVPQLFDRMTEQVYDQPITSFDPDLQPQPLQTILVLTDGMKALQRANAKMGLGLTDQLAQYLLQHCTDVLQRNITDVELFKYGQLNSEHCRHHRFGGTYSIDGQEMPYSLMDMIRQTVERNPGNVDKAFSDNSGGMARHLITVFIPSQPGYPSAFHPEQSRYCIIIKVESHNHPTGVEPYMGAATGTGGEIRDRQAFGRGGLPRTGFACYYVSHLRIPGYQLPWETTIGQYPVSLAKARDILNRASDGASDYGNCFGQPLILGATRSFEHLLGNEWLGYTKPIMIAGGVGLARVEHIEKGKPKPGLLVVQIGGDAYCIALGGAGRSSVDSGSEGAAAELDFDSVQRANSEMEQRTDRVVRTCIQLAEENPIVAIQDEGAGGVSVAATEIVDPTGARIYLRKIPSGDPTMSKRELYCNESQERLIILIKPQHWERFQAICERERCPVAVIGECTDDGKITVVDDDGSTPVDLGLDFLLSDLPKKRIVANRVPRQLQPLNLPTDLTVRTALNRVLRLIDVGSKDFLTHKVDRSVGGLVAQQQTVGPLQLTLADYAVTADSFDDLTGTAQAIGEQPIKGIIDSSAGVRMSIGEGLTNLMFARVDGFSAVNSSATWQWPAGHAGEDARLYDAVEAATCGPWSKTLGVRIFVGKDSLSMACKARRDGKNTAIKAPGTVQFFTVAPMPNITCKVTPDIKCPGESKLLFLDFSGGRMRLGGSALARVHGQLGDETPDVDDPDLLKRGFETVQELLSRQLILAGHDRSDGGLIITLLEMAFAGNCGLNLQLYNLNSSHDELAFFFNEELGAVIEYLPEHWQPIQSVLESHGLSEACRHVGSTTKEKTIRILNQETALFKEDMRVLRDIWQATSYQLDARQTHPSLVKAEQTANYDRPGLNFHLSFQSTPTNPAFISRKVKPKVAILREAGTNGDWEMARAFSAAGFESFDVTMTDLAKGRITLNQFRGRVLCGGFSNRDVLDAGKGWAAAIKFNKQIREQFERFDARSDTFSLNVCNGCQVASLLSLVPWSGIKIELQPRFIRNTSEIFGSRFVTAAVLPSPSIFFTDMAGSRIGIWVAHGEGRLHCPDRSILNRIVSQNLAPLRFVDDSGAVTEQYPFNPNGSPLGITALCTPDGRHLAMMPHPERLFLKWQWPWMPREWQQQLKASPWLKMFQNAYHWCKQ